MRIFTVFHPTPFCNLDCTYCWAPNRSSNRKMPFSIVEDTLRQIYANKSLSGMDVLWLTGEPLVMGLPYFRNAVNLCLAASPMNCRPEFIIQTNGTLIDERWCEFFAEYDFQVGVSVDGPPNVHDKQRVTKSGKPTFREVERGIDLLIKHRIRGGAICVITDATLDTPPDDLFQFFYSKGITWSYLVEASIGEHKRSSLSSTAEGSARFERYLSRLLDLWAEFPNSYIRDFDQTVRRVFGGSRPSGGDDNLGCLDILNVSADGSFFWGNPELMSASLNTLTDLRYNVNEHDVWEVRTTPSFRAYERQVHQGIDRCRNECQFFAGCQGGNPAHKYYEFGSFDVAQHKTCLLNDQTIQTLMIKKLIEPRVALAT